MNEYISGTHSEEVPLRQQSAYSPLDAILARLQKVHSTGQGRYTARCPAHPDKNPSLSIRTGNAGQILLHCFTGCTAEAIASALGLTVADLYADNVNPGSSSGQPALNLPERPEKPSERNTEKLRRLWGECRPIEWDSDRNPVTHYLRNRGLGAIAVDPPDNILLHPSMPYWTPGKVPTIMGRFAAMVARVQDAGGELVALHLTYLNDLGDKAKVPIPRKVRGKLPPGAAIRLYPPGNTLAVAEGIETALALRIGADFFKAPWATISAGGMARFRLPRPIERLDIFADRDKSEAGIKAARTLRAKMDAKGVDGRVFTPTDAHCRDVFRLRGETGKSVDWLDVLHHGGYL